MHEAAENPLPPDTGPAIALTIVDRVASEGVLKYSHLLPSAGGELLARLGRSVEARSEYEAATSLMRNVRGRQVLLTKIVAL